MRQGVKHKAADAIIRPLLDRAKTLLSQYEILLPEGQNETEFCVDIAVAVERAVFRICYTAAKLAAEYNNKIRSINFNLKKNNALADEVLNGGILPERLAEMSTDEMANKELKEYMAKVRIQAEINVTLVKTDGPRIRKTHKGEELVEPLQESSRSPGPEEILVPSVIQANGPRARKTRKGRGLVEPLWELSQSSRPEEIMAPSAIETDGSRVRKTRKGRELAEPLWEPSRSSRPEETLAPSAIETDGPRVRETRKGRELFEPSRSPRPGEISFPSIIEKYANDEPEEVQYGQQLMTQDLENSMMEPVTPPEFWSTSPTSPSRRSNSPNRGKQLSMLCGFDQAPEDSDSFDDFDDYNDSPPYMPEDVHTLIRQSQLEKSPSPPSNFYSPWDDQMGATDVVEESWVGRIEMKGIEGICTTGELMGGPDSISGVNWPTLLDELLHVDSEISPAVANGFLMDVCPSNSTSVMMVCLNPMDEADETEWTKVFDHFKSIGRYGAVRKHYHECISAMYLIFLDIHDRVPMWFQFLDPPSRVATNGRQTRMMFVVFAISQNQIAPPRPEIDEARASSWNPWPAASAIDHSYSTMNYSDITTNYITVNEMANRSHWTTDHGSLHNGLDDVRMWGE